MIFPTGYSDCFRQGKPAATVTLLNLGCMLGVLVFPYPLTSDMDYMLFNVHTDVNACSCTQGCTDTMRESALSIDSGRKIHYRTKESNLAL